MRALRREATERPRSAVEMADAIRQFAGMAAPSPDESVTQNLDAASAPDTIRDPQPPSYPIAVGVPRSPQQTVVRVVESWPSRSLGVVSSSVVLARLLDRPLHAAPFAGGVFIGGYCLLVFDGFIVGAVDAEGRSCDEVCEELPDKAVVVLHPIPDGVAGNLVPLLATLLHPPKVRSANLDTSLVNLPALANRLEEEEFAGILQLDRQGATGLIFFDQGKTILSLYSDGWEDLPIGTTWESWMSKVPLAATLLEKVWIPAHLSYRKELRDFAFAVAEPVRVGGANRLKQTLLRKTAGLGDSTGSTSGASRLKPQMQTMSPDDVAAMESFYTGDPVYRFLAWAVENLPAYFEERGRTSRWKYLVDWMDLVRKAVLHHTLPRPDSWEADTFDLVTFDGADKVLHVGHRVPKGTPEALSEFVERVVQAKKARTKTGDVGGAFLIAPAFEESMIHAYQQATRPVGTGLLSVEEKLTKYEGFIRMGPRRGFHLLLVVEKPEGFEPLLLV